MNGTVTRQNWFHSIGARLIFYLSLLFLAIVIVLRFITIMGLPFTPYIGDWGHVEAEVSRGLNLVADLKKERLLRWIQEQRTNIHLIAHNELIKSRVLQLKDPIRGKESFKILLNQLNSIKSYYSVYKMDESKSHYNAYKGICIVDAGSGIIIISTNEAEIGTSNVNRACFTRALKTGMDCIEDVSIDSLKHIPLLHIAHVLTDRQKAIGVLIMEIDLNDIIDPVLHIDGGLGESGEVKLLNREAKILNHLKYPLPDGSRPKPLMYQLTSRQARLAAGGKEGFIESRDYRGVAVLAAYRYIPITPEWGWGMVVKRDVSEVMAPFYRDISYVFIISLAASLVFIGITIMLVKSITQPISYLSQAAVKVAEGNLDTRAPISRLDEVGTLAAAFNLMVERIQNWHKELEANVEARTFELTEEIAGRKMLEEALRKERDKAQNYLDIVGVIIKVLDTDGTISLINKKGCEILGYKEDEIVGQNWFDKFLPDRIRKEAKDIFVRLVAGEMEQFEHETPVLTKTGEERTVLCRNVLIKDETGKGIAVLSSGEDITDHKRWEEAIRASEEKFRTLFEKAEIGIVLGRAEFFPERKEYILMGNPAIQKFLGYSEEELRRMSVLDFSYPGDIKRNEELFNEFMEGKRDSFDMDKRYIRKDGQVAWGHLTVSPVRDAAGKIIFTIATVQDITERKQVEEELQIYRGQLEKLVEERTAELKAAHEQLVHAEKLSALGRMAASISHEFNNPIYGIKMVLEQLQEEANLGKEYKKAAELALKETNRVARMVQNLQDFYQPSSGLIVPLDINQAIEDVLEIYGKKLKAGNINVVKDLADKIPLIPAVTDQIKQVFLNIITNAEEAMTPAGGTLTIQTKVLRDTVQILFKDTGHGISKENIRKLFSPFFTTKHEVKGTGLGLAVSYGIVRKHGGNILVDSAVGRGSTFTIELPLAGHLRTEI